MPEGIHLSVVFPVHKITCGHVIGGVRSAAEAVAVMVTVKQHQEMVDAVVVEVDDISAPRIVAARRIKGDACVLGFGFLLVFQCVHGAADADFGRIGAENGAAVGPDGSCRKIRIDNLAAGNPGEAHAVV